MKFPFKNKILLTFSVAVFSFFLATVVSAVWSGTFYSPGETLNPECLPSQTDCDVLPPLTATNISDTAYGAPWNGVTTIAPSKNAVYDKIELLAPIASPALTGAVTITGTNGGSTKALVVNNGTSTGNIFEAQDNGTAVFTIADGGNVVLTKSASISQNFEVIGYASISSFKLPLTTGGILGDCDAAGDTLNWDATTGKFVCGSDGGGVSSDSLDFDEFVPSMVLDTNTTITS